MLIVDDEPEVRRLCVDVASQTGLKAFAVATAEEAVEYLEHSAVDILLTDLKLPGTSGADLLRRVHELHPHVAVVVLTQYGTIDSALELTRLGAIMIRRQTTRLTTSASGPIQRINLGFEH